MLARQVRSSRIRSSLGPVSVYSCGSTTPLSHGSTRTRANSAAAGGDAVAMREALLVQIERGPLVADEDAFAAPLRERARRLRVRVALALRQLDTDDVVRARVVELLAFACRDDIVRRRERGARIAEPGRVVAKGAERANVSHGGGRRGGAM